MAEPRTAYDAWRASGDPRPFHEWVWGRDFPYPTSKTAQPDAPYVEPPTWRQIPSLNPEGAERKTGSLRVIHPDIEHSER